MIKIGGTSSWKTFTVTDVKTGEIKIEKRFYKADFDQLLKNPEYSSYLESLLELAMTHKMQDESEQNVDTESYEEVRSIALDIEDELGTGV